MAGKQENIKHLSGQDYCVSTWSGGRTVQLAIWPEDALYADRNFLWRISSATVDLEESDFTLLPDYMRLIAPVHGKMQLTHNGGSPVTLAEYQIHRFDGADSTHCLGKCTDFNLMLRKGAYDGRMLALAGGGEAEEECTIPPEPKAEITLVYNAAGSIAVFCGTAQQKLKEGEAALICHRQTGMSGPVALRFSPGSRAMAAQVWKPDAC